MISVARSELVQVSEYVSTIKELTNRIETILIKLDIPELKQFGQSGVSYLTNNNSNSYQVAVGPDEDTSSIENDDNDTLKLINDDSTGSVVVHTVDNLDADIPESQISSTQPPQPSSSQVAKFSDAQSAPTRHNNTGGNQLQKPRPKPKLGLKTRKNKSKTISKNSNIQVNINPINLEAIKKDYDTINNPTRIASKSPDTQQFEAGVAAALNRMNSTEMDDIMNQIDSESKTNGNTPPTSTKISKNNNTTLSLSPVKGNSAGLVGVSTTRNNVKFTPSTILTDEINSMLTADKLELLRASSNDMDQLKLLNDFIPLTLIKPTNITHNTPFNYELPSQESDLACHLYYEHLRKGTKYRYTNKELCQISIVLKPDFKAKFTIDCDWNFTHNNSNSNNNNTANQSIESSTQNALSPNNALSPTYTLPVLTDDAPTIPIHPSTESNVSATSRSSNTNTTPDASPSSGSNAPFSLANIAGIKWQRGRSSILITFEISYQVTSDREIELLWDVTKDKESYRKLMKCINDEDFKEGIINYDKNEKQTIEYTQDTKTIKSVYEQRFRNLIVNNDEEILNQLKSSNNNASNSNSKNSKRPQSSRVGRRQVQSNDILSGHRDAAVERKIKIKIRQIMDCKSTQYHNKYIEMCNEYNIKPKSEYFNFGKWNLRKEIKNLDSNKKRRSSTQKMKKRRTSAKASSKVSSKHTINSSTASTASVSSVASTTSDIGGTGTSGNSSLQPDWIKFSHSAMTLNEYNKKGPSDTTNGSNNGGNVSDSGDVEYVYVLERNEKRVFPYLKQGYMSNFY